MIEIVWRTRAVRHLDEIIDYIGARKPSAAGRYRDELQIFCEKLREFPESGRRYDHRYRVLFFRNHAIFYRIAPAEERVYIVAIIDSRRDVQRAMRSISE